MGTEAWLNLDKQTIETFPLLLSSMTGIRKESFTKSGRGLGIMPPKASFTVKGKPGLDAD